jgi:hypothetical protein
VNFEASGGLLNSSLVMQDRETDTYWSIMSGDAIAGKLEGTKLIELPVSQKMQWKDWLELHPDTLVLSVNGREDITVNPYQEYFDGSRGFREARAEDKRLKTREPIYAFQRGTSSYAARSGEIRGGRVFALADGSQIFLYRPEKSDLFLSTAAFVSKSGFEKRDGVWTAIESGARFDEEALVFIGGAVERLRGFDTFWYTWSLTHPETTLLK